MLFRILIPLAIIIGIFYFVLASKPSNMTRRNSTSVLVRSSKSKELLNSLKNTQNFIGGALDHIFLGSTNRDGQVEGFHYASIDNSVSYIIPQSKTAPNKYGVYRAKAIIGGKHKTNDNGYSTFFPSSLSPQQVVNTINEAYKTRYHIKGNIYVGIANNGMEIEMYLTNDNKIISAFPIY